jgi:small-conductance mechanosensitive channel
MDVQQSLNIAIYERFAAEGVEFAFPTRTVFLRGEQAGAALRRAIGGVKVVMKEPFTPSRL